MLVMKHDFKSCDTKRCPSAFANARRRDVLFSVPKKYNVAL